MRNSIQVIILVSFFSTLVAAMKLKEQIRAKYNVEIQDLRGKTELLVLFHNDGYVRFRAKDNNPVTDPAPDVSALRDFIVVSQWTYCVNTTITHDVLTYLNNSTKPEDRSEMPILGFTYGKEPLRLDQEFLDTYENAVVDTFLTTYGNNIEWTKVKFGGIKNRVFNGASPQGEVKQYVMFTILLSETVKD